MKLIFGIFILALVFAFNSNLSESPSKIYAEQQPDMKRATTKWHMTEKAEADPFSTTDQKIYIRLDEGVQSVYLKTQGTVTYTDKKEGMNNIAPGTYLQNVKVVNRGMIWPTIDCK